jgi:hypothetical protein
MNDSPSFIQNKVNTSNYNIYVFWTGDNPMSDNRKSCLEQLKLTTGVNITLITPNNLSDYILPEHPLHPGYQYLSFTQRGDYLKAYFMNFYGGGYSDIKKQSYSWIESFKKLENSNDKWIIGYKELSPRDIAYKPNADKWQELIGNGAYICKPKTPLTQEWYNEMISLMDKKLERLMEYPASFPQDCAEVSNGRYPIEWNELNGRIFHRVSYEYKDKLLNTLPPIYYDNYR